MNDDPQRPWVHGAIGPRQYVAVGNGQPLTARQYEYVCAIERFVDKHARFPGIRELGALLGVRSTNGVEEQLRLIAAKGFVEAIDGRAGKWGRWRLVIRTDDMSSNESHLADVLAEFPARRRRAIVAAAMERAAARGTVGP